MGEPGNVLIDPTIEASGAGNATPILLNAENELTSINISGSLESGGDMFLNAESGENMYSASVAGTKAGGSDGGIGGGGTGGEQKSAGIGISGDVSINLITDDTQAYIAGGAFVDTGSGNLALKADNSSFDLAVSGALTLTTGGSGGAALAGSYSQNELDRITKAYTQDAAITANNVDLDANSTQ